MEINFSVGWNFPVLITICSSIGTDFPAIRIPIRPEAIINISGKNENNG